MGDAEFAAYLVDPVALVIGGDCAGNDTLDVEDFDQVASSSTSFSFSPLLGAEASGLPCASARRGVR